MIQPFGKRHADLLSILSGKPAELVVVAPFSAPGGGPPLPRMTPEGAELVISALGATVRPIDVSAPGRSIHGWIAARPANAWTAFLTRGG